MGRAYNTVQEWLNEGEKRFGIDMQKWQFVCPMCGRVNTGKEFVEKHEDWRNTMYQECIGCDYKSYGVLPMTCDTVKSNGRLFRAFPFAEVKNDN